MNEAEKINQILKNQSTILYVLSTDKMSGENLLSIGRRVNETKEMLAPKSEELGYEDSIKEEKF